MGLLADFVIEKPNQKTLYMVNPDFDGIIEALRKFANQLRQINPDMKIIITIPSYKDFIQYSKAFKHLSPMDFTRLESFSAQTKDNFDRLYETVRFLSKNVFCFNFNITLADPKKRVPQPMGMKPIPTHVLMKFYDQTLQDG